MTENKKLTLGEQRVRTKFNPSSDNKVDIIKQKTAEMINFVHKSQIVGTSSEYHRLCALAMTAYEEAGMWAVKALTINK